MNDLSSPAPSSAGAPAATVLAIDPGTTKCGLAVVRNDPDRCRALHREIAPTERVLARVLTLLPAYPEIRAVLIGNATGGAALARALRAELPDGIPLHAVDEAFTSQRARARFQIENPPRGLMRLVPPGLRTPPRAYDDFVAVLLAEDWFHARPAP